MIVGTWPGDAGGPVFIRGYEGGTYEQLIEADHRDASRGKRRLGAAPRPNLDRFKPG